MDPLPHAPPTLTPPSVEFYTARWVAFPDAQRAPVGTTGEAYMANSSDANNPSNVDPTAHLLTDGSVLAIGVIEWTVACKLPSLSVRLVERYGQFNRVGAVKRGLSRSFTIVHTMIRKGR